MERVETLISKETIAQRVKEIALDIENHYQGEEIVAIAILKGSVFFFSDLLKEIKNQSRIEFMGLSSYGGSTESSGQVRCTLDLSSSIEGKNVLVVEDIIDTGLSIHFLKNNLNNRKPKSLRFCTLLDKPENRKINFTPEFVGFTIPNKFVVGYGLDYDQKYRNLPFIGVLHFEN